MTCEAEGAFDRAWINAAGAGSHGGEDADAAGGFGFKHATCSSFDDTDDDHRNFPRSDGFADVFKAISRGGVASDDDGFNRRLGELRFLAFSGPESTAEEKNYILHDQCAQVVGALYGGVVAVGHVGLIAEVDEALLRKIGHAIGPRLQSVVVEGVECEQSFEHSESTDARVEHADGQVAGGFVIAPSGGIETERSFAIGMSLGVLNEISSVERNCKEQQTERFHTKANNRRPKNTAATMPTKSAVSPASNAWRKRRMPTLPK